MKKIDLTDIKRQAKKSYMTPRGYVDMVLLTPYKHSPTMVQKAKLIKEFNLLKDKS